MLNFAKTAKNKKGFTLIELLVSIALFSIVVTIAMGSIVTIIDTNRKSQTLTLVINNMNFALESITRTIKTGTDIVEISEDVVEVRNQSGQYVTYLQEDETIKKCVSDTQGVCNTFVPIVSDQVKVETFGLDVIGGSTDQLRVLIKVGGYAEITSRIRSDFNIQTTVSPRELQL